jgi:glutamate/tyrosine decarboxylase-like PLP-dependent enzyme
LTKSEDSCKPENLFLNPNGENSQDFIELVKFALEACSIWWASSNTSAIPRDDELKEIKQKLYTKFKSGQDVLKYAPIRQLLERLCESTRLNDKNFVNVHPQPLLNSVVATLLVTLQNPNNISPDVSLPTRQMEEECIEYLKDILGLKNGRDGSSIKGTLVFDGTLGNLTALFVAAERNKRDQRRESALWAPRSHEGYLITTKNAHYSVRKCARILGFGDSYIREVPVAVDEEYISKNVGKVLRRNAEELQKFYNGESYPFSLQPQVQDFEEHFRHIDQKKGKIDAVVVTHGTTLTGTIESVDGLIKMRQRLSPFFLHVDAATGGFARLIPELKEKMSAIDEADSVIVDPHKLGYVPYPCGAILFRHKEDFQLMQELNTSPNLEKVMPTIEGSRPGTSAASFWIAVKTLGVDGYKKLVSKCLEYARYLATLLDEHKFQVLHTIDLNTVCFTIKNANSQNKANEAIAHLYKRITEEGEYKINFVSDFCQIRVRERHWDNRSQLVEIRAIRAVVTNPFTTESTLENFVEKLAYLRDKYI